jgi:hypothetical protein
MLMNNNIIKNFQLFENTQLNYQWSDYYLNKDETLKEMYSNLEIINENGKEYVILHHFGSKLAYHPQIDYLTELEKLIYTKMNWNEKPNDEEIEEFYNKVNEEYFKDIDRLEIFKFLTYSKRYTPNDSTLNAISQFLGYSYYSDFQNSLDISNFNITTGLDPKYFGSDQATRDDIAQLAFNVTMFYINLKDKEHYFGKGYSYFKIKYPLEKLYPIKQDPLDIGGSSFKERMELVRDKNFDGQIVMWKLDNNNNKQYRCDIWKFIPITYTKNGITTESEYLLEYEEY